MAVVAATKPTTTMATLTTTTATITTMTTKWKSKTRSCDWPWHSENNWNNDGVDVFQGWKNRSSQRPHDLLPAAMLPTFSGSLPDLRRGSDRPPPPPPPWARLLHPQPPSTSSTADRARHLCPSHTTRPLSFSVTYVGPSKSLAVASTQQMARVAVALPPPAMAAVWAIITPRAAAPTPKPPAPANVAGYGRDGAIPGLRFDLFFRSIETWVMFPSLAQIMLFRRRIVAEAFVGPIPP